MTRTISDTDIAALVAIRSVIADAFSHPGQKAAIEAIDRLTAPGPGCAECEKRKQADDRFATLVFTFDPKKVDADAAAKMLAPEPPAATIVCYLCDALVTKATAMDLSVGHAMHGVMVCEVCEPKAHSVLWSRRKPAPRTPREILEQAIESWKSIGGPTRWNRTTSAPGILLVDDPYDTSRGDPDPNVVETWFNSVPALAPRLDAQVIEIPPQRFVRHQLFDAKCDTVKNWRCLGCGGTAATSPTEVSHECGRCGMRMIDAMNGPTCYVCAVLVDASSVNMTTSINGETQTVTTCGDIECRLAVARTHMAATTQTPKLFAVKWTSPEGRSGLGAERASRAYLERSLSARQPGWTYEIVPAPDGDQPHKFERDYVPAAWLDEACALLEDAVSRAEHGSDEESCWDCKVERFLESL